MEVVTGGVPIFQIFRLDLFYFYLQNIDTL